MDLFYRLNVVRLEIAPLRQRREDIPMLVHHFLRKHMREGSSPQGIEDDALELLVARDWPGNVRELENVVESSLALAGEARLRVADLPASAGSIRQIESLPVGSMSLTLDAYEKLALERALSEAGGDARTAARRLGIGRSTFYRKLSKHGLEVRGAARVRSRRGVGGPGLIG
jgi:DNA-binding NtrC family response regulator